MSKREIIMEWAGLSEVSREKSGVKPAASDATCKCLRKTFISTICSHVNNVLWINHNTALLSTRRALFCSLIILNRTICFRLFNVSSKTSMHCIVTFYNYPFENTLSWLRHRTEPFIYMTKIIIFLSIS